MGKEHWLQLALADGIGPVTLKRLLDAAGSAEAACAAGLPLLRSIEGIGTTRADQIRKGLQDAGSEGAGAVAALRGDGGADRHAWRTIRIPPCSRRSTIRRRCCSCEGRSSRAT